MNTYLLVAGPFLLFLAAVFALVVSLNYLTMHEDNRDWISRVWGHYWEAKKKPNLMTTRFWDCVRCSWALIFDLTWQPSKGEPDYGIPPENASLAWITRGRASWEYGGTAWDYIACVGWRYFVGSDSSV